MVALAVAYPMSGEMIAVAKREALGVSALLKKRRLLLPSVATKTLPPNGAASIHGRQ
ncbi:hypothetical protein CY34DRAFT_16905 [Suillus luteus UH-Slu-Lm8-n1]|uniref:Uncharacterized protein n=1 Tax=Suillus luteus UH-Slu-Lm8-n1 TaxID=930992 RepID=A0A0D0A1J4_9AGAM|nr:hypothetical protein CY34DRAFT_16905 [Suillus luteus UH-Slu-Lm8-n1]